MSLRFPVIAVMAFMAAFLVGVVGGVAPAAAQSRRSVPDRIPVTVSMRALTPDAGEGLHRVLIEVRPAGPGPVEVVADRRLLELRFTPEGSRRSFRCRHPDRPRRVRDGRVRTLGAGGEDRWTEVIDLRMFCWRVLDQLSAGGRIEGTWGFGRRGTSRRWVARVGDQRVGRVELPTIAVPAGPLTAPADPHPTGEAPPVTVELRRVDRTTGGAVLFPVAVRGTAPTRIYMRDDLLRFRVSGPLGEVVCTPRRQTIVPIVDFYRRIDRRRAARTSVEASRWCPDGTFDLAGIYEVTPIVDLVYDGSRYDLDVTTGTFVGEPTLLRIRRGDRGYVEQLPGGTWGGAAETGDGAKGW